MKIFTRFYRLSRATLPGAFLLAVASVPATATTQPIALDGAAGINVQYEAGTAPHWYIEEQRYGVDYVERGIAQENPALISQGLQIFDWGFAREASDGSFPGSGNGAVGEQYHSASMFLEAVARSTVELKRYKPLTYTLSASTYGPKITQYTNLIHLTARWLTGATDPTIPATLQAYNAPYTHRRYLVGAALQESAVLTSDTALTTLANQYIDDGLSKKLPSGWQAALKKQANGTYPPAILVAPGAPLPTGTTSVISALGVNPESNGYDVNYQAVGARYAECYYNFSTDATRNAAVKAMLSDALTWEASRVNTVGAIDVTGSSRIGVETDLSGTIKVLSPTVVRDCLLKSLSISNKTAIRVAGNRVNGVGKKVSAVTVAADGAAGANIDWETGKASTWNIGTQRCATDWINAGIACANDAYIQQGFAIFDWGWAHQLSDGSFGTTSSNRFATAQFVEAAARSIIALKSFNPTKYAAKISAYTPKIGLGASWLASDPVHVMGSVKNYVSHDFGVATCFAEAGALTGSTAFYTDALPYLQQGMSLQMSNGEDPENGAADVNWQGISLLYEEWFLPYCTDATLAAQIKTNLSAGLMWELPFIDANGFYAGQIAPQTIFNAFAGGATILGNKEFQVIANRIDNLY